MNNVLELRKRKGMQQKELALLVGVTSATVSEWEHGKKDPSKDRLKKLCEVFETTPSVILGYSPVSEKASSLRMPTDEELLFALFDGVQGITKEDFEDVKKYARFVAQRRQGLL